MCEQTAVTRKPDASAEQPPEPAAGEPARGPAGEPLADPAALDRLVVAEEPGKRVEKPACLIHAHVARSVLGALRDGPWNERKRQPPCLRGRIELDNPSSVKARILNTTPLG
jgi:hypothetical protein